MLKISTFNANSIRARLQIVLDWLDREKPDVLAIQETKVQDAEFPADEFRSRGWHVVYKGQKSYNGVAFVSRAPLELLSTRLTLAGAGEEEARFMTARVSDVLLVNTYVPQGFLIDSPKYVKKLKFLSDLRAYFLKNIRPDQPALWMGDLNVAPSEIDLADPEKNRNHVCFHVDARQAFHQAAEGLWIDLFREKEKGPGHYTFWDYFPATFRKNLGWRIDHILGTRPMAERLQRIWIDKAPRALERPSDHTFLTAEFSKPA